MEKAFYYFIHTHILSDIYLLIKMYCMLYLFINQKWFIKKMEFF